MKDLLLGSGRDLMIVDGDLVIGESSNQQAELLFMLPKGSLKESLDVGVGASDYLESEDRSGLLREIKKQFTNDGLSVTFKDGKPIVITN